MEAAGVEQLFLLNGRDAVGNVLDEHIEQPVFLSPLGVFQMAAVVRLPDLPVSRMLRYWT